MSKVKYIVAFLDGSTKAYSRDIGEADAETGIRAIIAATPYVRTPKGFVVNGTSVLLTAPAKPKASRPTVATVAPVTHTAPKGPKAGTMAALMHGRSRAAKAAKLAHDDTYATLVGPKGHVKASIAANKAAKLAHAAA